jgi:hypothetical protein
MGVNILIIGAFIIANIKPEMVLMSLILFTFSTFLSLSPEYGVQLAVTAWILIGAVYGQTYTVLP